MRQQRHLRLRAASAVGWSILRFFTIEADAIAQFDTMKDALSEILAIIPMADDPEGDVKMDGVSKAMGLFIQRYP